MNEFDFLMEATKAQNPIYVDKLEDLFNQLSVGDNLFIKRTSDKINVSIIQAITNLSYRVKANKKMFNISCLYDQSINDNVFTVIDYNSGTPVYTTYTDIESITVSDKNVLSKIIFGKNNNQNNNQNNNTQNNTQNNNQTNNQSKSNSIDKALDRLKGFMDEMVYKMYSGYVKVKNGLIKPPKPNNTPNPQPNTAQQNGIQVNYKSLSQNMTRNNDQWETFGDGMENLTPTPQSFSGTARQIKQLLSDVLLTCNTDDEITLIVSATQQLEFKVELAQGRVVRIKNPSPNHQIVVNRKYPLGGQSFSMGELSTDYSQPEVVRIGNKNKVVLPLYANSTISAPNEVYEIEGIHSFTFTPDLVKTFSDALNIRGASLGNNFKLSDGAEVVITYENYTNKINSEIATLTFSVKADNGMFKISNSQISELDGLHLTNNSFQPTFYSQEDSIMTGYALETVEGVALGNILNVEVIDSAAQDSEDDDADINSSMSDEEIYSYIMNDKTLRSYVIQKPSFFAWLKQKKNNFNNAKLDTRILDLLSQRIGSSRSLKASRDGGFVSDSFFKVIVLDANGLNGIYGHNLDINTNAKFYVKIKSSNRRTIMYAYQTMSSKPSIVLKSNDNVFDINTNSFTSDKIKVGVYENNSKVGEIVLKVN